MKVKDAALLALASGAAGAIGMGFARDTKLKRRSDWLRSQYHQARTEIYPMVRGTESQNIGTDVFRALQIAYARGVADMRNGHVGSGKSSYLARSIGQDVVRDNFTTKVGYGRHASSAETAMQQALDDFLEKQGSGGPS